MVRKTALQYISEFQQKRTYGTKSRSYILTDYEDFASALKDSVF